MRKLSFAAVAAALLFAPATSFASVRQHSTSATDICRHVRYIIIDGDLYEEIQCVFYTSGLV
jgi:hypothetical protein